MNLRTFVADCAAAAAAAMLLPCVPLDVVLREWLICNTTAYTYTALAPLLTVCCYCYCNAAAGCHPQNLVSMQCSETAACSFNSMLHQRTSLSCVLVWCRQAVAQSP